MSTVSLTPKETVGTIMDSALKKIGYSLSQRILLGIMAGAYIALGSYGFIVAYENTFLRAAVFPVGLMLIVIIGGELFTGNCLMTFALLQRKIKFKDYVVSLIEVLVSNFIGAIAIVVILYFGGAFNAGGMAETAVKIANAKINLTFLQGLLRGILCNMLVTSGVWFASMSGSVTGKILGCWFPVMLFVFCGYEHSVANMFFLPMGAMLDSSITVTGILSNLVPVIIGNYIGGGIIIPFIYDKVYYK